jgi:hypothetical protein
MSILIFARRDSCISVIHMLYLRDSFSKYSGKTNPIRVSYDLKTAVLISHAS